MTDFFMCEPDLVITRKLFLIGDKNVGKTSLIQYLVNSVKVGQGMTQEPTLGVNFSQMVLNINGKEVRLQIWDTAGDERFRDTIISQINKADGLFVVFDISNKSTYNNLEEWIAQAKEKVGDIPIVINANKSDLDPAVTEQEIFELEEKHGISCFKTSAATGSGIIESVQQITQQILDSPVVNDRYKNVVNPVNTKQDKKNCC